MGVGGVEGRWVVVEGCGRRGGWWWRGVVGGEWVRKNLVKRLRSKEEEIVSNGTEK